MPPFPTSPAWHALLAHRDALAGRRISELWEEDAGRGAALTFACAGIAADFSKQRVTSETIALLVALARDRGLPAAIERLFAGERINTTENRPALHTALRGDERVAVDGHDVRPEIQRNQVLPDKVGPEDVVPLALFLAADDSRACSAQEYIVDAGWL